jgi:toluene monooxygenase system ferredoxin subunit
VALRVRVCTVDEVDDQLRGYWVHGVTWPVMVTRLAGELVAFPGVCPHDDVSLVDYGVLEGGELHCRVHGYRFDIASGRCEHQPQLHLRRYRVTIIDRDVWVDLL